MSESFAFAQHRQHLDAQGLLVHRYRYGSAPAMHPAEAFLRHILRARITEHDGIGIGRDVRFAHTRVAGAGLVVGDELVQLTAFPEDAADAADGEAPVARIRRPSRRRAA